VSNGRRCVALDELGVGVVDAGVVVMGLDQHRAQITAEWIDTGAGEVYRARVSPADREGVRRFDRSKAMDSARLRNPLVSRRSRYISISDRECHPMDRRPPRNVADPAHGAGPSSAELAAVAP
jgi:hypothetical protein